MANPASREVRDDVLWRCRRRRNRGGSFRFNLGFHFHGLNRFHRWGLDCRNRRSNRLRGHCNGSGRGRNRLRRSRGLGDNRCRRRFLSVRSLGRLWFWSWLGLGERLNSAVLGDWRDDRLRGGDGCCPTPRSGTFGTFFGAIFQSLGLFRGQTAELILDFVESQLFSVVKESLRLEVQLFGESEHTDFLVFFRFFFRRLRVRQAELLWGVLIRSPPNLPAGRTAGMPD
jgi:hypothetical protein